MRIVHRTLTTTPWKDCAATSAPSPDRGELRQRVAAAMREHHLTSNRAEADADGNMPCCCGGWREPGPMGSDEDDWDTHLGDVGGSAVVNAPSRPAAGRARGAATTGR